MQRKLLIVAVCALATFDACFLFTHRNHDDGEILAEWVAYMPSLEQRQRRDPTRLLYSFHHWDPAYPETYIVIDGGLYPLLPKIAHECRVPRYVLSQFFGSTHMPDRLFVGSMLPEAEKCLRRSLPSGYILARMLEPIAPNETGWAEGGLSIDPSTK